MWLVFMKRKGKQLITVLRGPSLRKDLNRKKRVKTAVSVLLLNLVSIMAAYRLRKMLTSKNRSGKIVTRTTIDSKVILKEEGDKAEAEAEEAIKEETSIGKTPIIKEITSFRVNSLVIKSTNLRIQEAKEHRNRIIGPRITNTIKKDKTEIMVKTAKGSSMIGEIHKKSTKITIMINRISRNALEIRKT